MSIKSVLIVLTIAALLASLIWLLYDGGLEPLITSIGLIGALLAEIFSGGSNGGTNVKMQQKGGRGSKNYQSSGNIVIRNATR